MFLSATIPNAREFAEWVAKTHRSPCHVVYTDYRPTPLQHYVFPAGVQGRGGGGMPRGLLLPAHCTALHRWLLCALACRPQDVPACLPTYVVRRYSLKGGMRAAVQDTALLSYASRQCPRPGYPPRPGPPLGTPLPPLPLPFPHYSPAPPPARLPGGDGLFMVVDERGVFREDNFQKAVAVLTDADASAKASAGACACARL